MSRVLFTAPPSGQETRSGEASSSYTADAAWEAFKKTVEPLKPSQRHGRAQSWNKETGGTGGTGWFRNKKAQESGMAPGIVSAPLYADTVRRAIRSGKFRPHATLDLHGMTCEQARVELNAFFERARIKQWQTCLIITGKGDGILSRFFSETWLQTTPFRPCIRVVAPAHPRQGGPGAWCVFLKHPPRTGHPPTRGGQSAADTASERK